MAENKYSLIIDFSRDGKQNISAGEKAKQKQEKIENALQNYIKTQAIKPFISYMENITVQNIQFQTGSRQLAERTQLIFDAVQGGINLFQTVQGGIAFGASLGIGAFAGGALAVGAYALSIGLNLAQRQSQINNNKKIEDINRSYILSRNGASFNKSRQGA